MLAYTNKKDEGNRQRQLAYKAIEQAMGKKDGLLFSQRLDVKNKKYLVIYQEYGDGYARILHEPSTDKFSIRDRSGNETRVSLEYECALSVIRGLIGVGKKQEIKVEKR